LPEDPSLLVASLPAFLLLLLGMAVLLILFVSMFVLAKHDIQYEKYALPGKETTWSPKGLGDE
jgi:hypothetical protein